MLVPARLIRNSGGRIRTSDLRVMGPTSYQTALPRDQFIAIGWAAQRSLRFNGTYACPTIILPENTTVLAADQEKEATISNSCESLRPALPIGPARIQMTATG